MTRLQADLCLLLTAIIWGTAFIAQKTGMEGLGPLGFTGARFALSALVVLPLALRERRTKAPMGREDLTWALLGLIPVFSLGAICQQAGMMTTTVTNAGFLTGLYVVIVPFFAWALYRRMPPAVIWPACALALAGVWLLNGAKPLGSMAAGDWLVIASAVFYGAQVALVGLLAQRTARPVTLACLQYAGCAALALGAAFLFEDGITVSALEANMMQLLYAGVISGGIAYTMQIVGQQYTPPSHAAIILMGEAPFAALAGAALLSERLDVHGWVGCGVILAAALLAEAGAFIKKRADT
jgi:drug/metabolite transporter (DMT)-like permease